MSSLPLLTKSVLKVAVTDGKCANAGRAKVPPGFTVTSAANRARVPPQLSECGREIAVDRIGATAGVRGVYKIGPVIHGRCAGVLVGAGDLPSAAAFLDYT